MGKKKLDYSDIQFFPDRGFTFWFGQYLLSAMALKFHAKNKRFPKYFKRSSVRMKGRTISMEMN